jgi:hypothetical protein
MFTGICIRELYAAAACIARACLSEVREQSRAERTAINHSIIIMQTAPKRVRVRRGGR